MQCVKFEQRLQQVLDDCQNAEQDELLRAHAQRCDACNNVLRTQRFLMASLKSLPEPNIAVDLGPRVLDRLRIDQRRRVHKRRLLAALATAAALLIALLPLAGEHVRFRPERGGGGLAIATPSPHALPASELTEQETEELRLLMHQWLLRLSDHRLAMFEPVDQLAHGIRPLTITFNFALDTLRRTLPGYSQPQPAEPQALYRRFPTWIS